MQYLPKYSRVPNKRDGRKKIANLINVLDGINVMVGKIKKPNKNVGCNRIGKLKVFTLQNCNHGNIFQNCLHLMFFISSRAD